MKSESCYMPKVNQFSSKKSSDTGQSIGDFRNETKV